MCIRDRHTSIYLNSFLLIIDLQVNLRILHQGPKLRFVVINVIVSIFYYSGMVATDRRWIHSDLALVTSAHSYSLSWNVFDTEERWIFDLNLLKDHVLSFGHVDCHQLEHSLSFLYVFWVLFFTYLTKKLLEIVVSQTFYFIFFNFGLVPSLQTEIVD